MISSEYRHELKYICTESQLACVKNRISTVMQIDPHTGADGSYTIRSLYFDDYGNTCFYENENGTDPREKFRIRIYNHDAAHIKLELKRKEHAKTRKISCTITEKLCRDIMDRKPLDINAVDSPVYRKFCLQIQTRLLQPRVIVEYDRIPYIYQNGNVRVTFDKNVRSGISCNQFLEEYVPMRPIMPGGHHVLEVKYDAYIPDYIYRGVQIENLQQTAYSKYYLCRKYNLGGAHS